jgi:hypothetical protein
MRFEEASHSELLTAVRTLLQERNQLQRQLAQLHTLQERQARELAAVEKENATLGHLQVASRLLHRTLDRRAVVTAIQEIVVNLVGSEQLALFERDGERLQVVSVFGVDERAWNGRPDQGVIGECARSGELLVAAPAEPSVCVPLRVDDRVVGVLVLFRLLAHKCGLEDVDYALFDLLSQQAGVALASTREARPWK